MNYKVKTPFMELYEELSEIHEERNGSRPYSQGTVEAAKAINLADCRMIASDVKDIRGEIEESACLIYNGVLTRVAASVLPFRDGPEGKEVFLKLWRSAVYLLGGGIDLNKDGTDPIKTVERESFEESNIRLANIKDSGASYWEYNEKPWVERHVANPVDRWNGYYTWLFTADYVGTGDNDLPEESGNFRWYKVSDILARPDTKKLKFIKQAIIAGGYNKPLAEDFSLTESKQLGLVSYAIRASKDSMQPLKALENILYSGVIKASTEEDGSKYVSTSRNILSHLGASSDWKYGIVLDGDKLTNKYKFTPVNYNSMVYFSPGKSNKQLELKSIAKYQAKDASGQFLDKYFYIVKMNGNSFLTELTEPTYNILKTIMNAYNAELAVKPDGKAQDKYKGKLNKEVKNYYELRGNKKLSQDDWKQYVADNNMAGEQVPNWMDKTTDTLAKGDNPSWMMVGTVMQKGRVPKRHAGFTWVCVETIGYNVKNSGLLLKVAELNKYKELVISQHGVDITAADFFMRVTGTYADESEERATARLVQLVNEHGIISTENEYGLNIEGCVKAILIDEKHTMAFTMPKDELLNRKILYLYQDGKQTAKTDNTPNIARLAFSIREFTDAHSIPIIFFSQYTTNQEIISKIYK